MDQVRVGAWADVLSTTAMVTVVAVVTGMVTVVGMEEAVTADAAVGAAIDLSPIYWIKSRPTRMGRAERCLSERDEE